MNSDLYTFTYEPIPIKKNIEYVFQRLIIPIISSTGFIPYKKSHGKYEKILDIVTKWLIIYTNTNDLTQINWEEFINIKQQLFELDSKYLSSDGLYAEEAYEWVLQLQILLEKLIRERNDKNGI